MGAISERDRSEERVPQRTRALACANRVRTRRALVKRRIHVGEATVAEALEERHDECLRNASIMELLLAQRGWGRERAVALLEQVGVRESRALRRLTERQVSAFTRALRPDRS